MKEIESTIFSSLFPPLGPSHLHVIPDTSYVCPSSPTPPTQTIKLSTRLATADSRWHVI